MKHSDLICTLVALGMFSTIGLAGAYVGSLSKEQAAELAKGLKETKISSAVRSESITRAIISPVSRPDSKTELPQNS